MSTKIPFDKEVGGYNKVQVDSYLKLLSEAYSEAFAEYDLICKKYNALLDKFYYGEGGKNKFAKEISKETTKQIQAAGEFLQYPNGRSKEAACPQVEKTLEDYYQEAMKLDSVVASLALK